MSKTNRKNSKSPNFEKISIALLVEQTLILAVLICMCALIIFGRSNKSLEQSNINDLEPVIETPEPEQKIEPISELNIRARIDSAIFIPEISFAESEPEEVIEEEPIDPSTLEGKDLYIYYIHEICNGYENVDPYLVMAMIESESKYNPNATGALGEQGLLQMMPQFFKNRMKKLEVEDLYDPYSNILVAVDYISELLYSRESVEYMLMEYNGGPEYAQNMHKYNKVSDYASDIIARAAELKGADANA